MRDSRASEITPVIIVAGLLLVMAFSFHHCLLRKACRQAKWAQKVSTLSSSLARRNPPALPYIKLNVGNFPHGNIFSKKRQEDYRIAVRHLSTSLEYAMFKPLLLVLLSFLPVLAGAANLTELEKRWLSAAGPVLAYSQRINLPIDIIVQPQPRPGDVPMAMGFVDGRCKLVLSMRGNPDAETILQKVPEAERALMIEAMAAHEIGHCWRYVQGVWHALPAGFVEAGEEQAANASLLAESKAMREMRREEGFADLVALAWIKQKHPEHYGRVHAWMESVRSDVPVDRSGHDTRVWVRLARDASVFPQAATPFEAANATWSKGLLNDD